MVRFTLNNFLQEIISVFWVMYKKGDKLRTLQKSNVFKPIYIYIYIYIT